MSAGDDVEYVLLDADLQRRDPARFEHLLAQFARGYEQQFHGDEAEAAAAWPARIAGLPPPWPVLNVMVALAGSGPVRRVVGGLAAEYYRASRVALATYLYVDDSPQLRGRGHARALMRHTRAALAATGPVDLALAEVEWPAALPAALFNASALAQARSRLGFFTRVGARRVHVDYVQPALQAGAQPVAWLRLLALDWPLHDGRPDDARIRTSLRTFLAEFHGALAAACGTTVDPALLALQQAAVDTADPLTSPL